MKTTTITNSKLFQSIITVCIFTAFSIAQNTLSIEVGDGTIDVLYNSDADIGGFQFTVEGATVTGGSGGDSAANGFMISCSSTMCLGFSLAGSVIPAGSGTLVVVSADITGDVSLTGIVVSDAVGGALDFTYDGGDVYGCMDMDACNYNADATEDDGSCALDDCSGECGGSAVEDECGECGGDGSSCATSTIDIFYNTTTDIGGFQFDIDGATVTGASGGAAAEAGFTISTGNNTVLAFSFSGATIPAGSGVLVQVEVQGDASAACLSAVVLSDPIGVAIENEVTDCFTISQVEIILGCMDDTACNYDADATEGDGSCEYAQENYDCDGNCTVEVDCTGECGGDAVVDECGICDGTGIGHGACDCDGNVEDCAGECGGSAVVDECGVCDGDGTSCIPVQLGFGTVADGNMGITYDSPADIAGFQFYVSGVNVISADGGDAADAGFSTSTGNNTVLGFSFTGGTIPAGSGVLIELGYEATADQACLESPVISDPDGEGLDIEIGSCADLDYACDDVDTDGICDDVDDCVGEFDECGECNGDGIDEGACDCDGNVDLGCGCGEAGPSGCDETCGSTLENDECGVCGGDGIADGACDCAGNVVDECGECGGDGIADGACDCEGNVDLGCGCGEAGPSGCDETCGSTLENDECGVCGGSGIPDGECDCDGNVDLGCGCGEAGPSGCDNSCESTLENDECGVCGGSGIPDGECDCDGNVDLGCGCGEAGPSGCDNSCESTLENDECGVCGGDGSSCTATVDLSIDLIAGWNWISLNVLPDDPSVGTVLAGLGNDALFINSQTGGASTNYPQYGMWAGALAAFEPGNMYLLQMDAPATLIVTGVPVDVASTPIELIAGWNWLGYLPQNTGAVGEALESLGVDALFINSQVDGASTNYPQYGMWAGALATLEAGKGYLLSVDAPATFTYPEFDGLARLAANKQGVILSEKISDWDFNYGDYEFIGTITTSIESHVDADGDVVAVFVDGKCRGLAERMLFPLDDTYYYMIQVYSNAVQGEELTFRYYDKTNDEVITYSETLTFENNMIVGDGFNTLGLSRERNLSQPKAYGIGDAYPNPFNPVTSFEYTMPEDGMLQVAVYDINGRQVAELVNGYMSAGTYPVTWDANDLSSGVYMLQMISGDFTAIQKIMLIK